MVPGVERQLCVDDCAADAEAFQEEAQAESGVHGIDKQQHLLLHQAQLKKCHGVQQLVRPANGRQLKFRFLMHIARFRLDVCVK